MDETAETKVRLSHVSKRFGPSLAVDDVSLNIPAGSFTTLLGPSGCGKTTTLRMIAGFYDPDAGDIFIGDQRINDVPAHRRKTAMVFQDYALFPHMTVAENVSYGPRLAGIRGAALAQRLRATLDFLGLTGLDHRHPNQLSGGQQQRVALARALVMQPSVLLLDEPLSNLDAQLRVSIRAELNAIQRQLRITTIYVTHDQDEALAMSDWLAVLDGGRVVQWGTPWEIYYHPHTPFMAEFLGSVNLISAPIVRIDGSSVRVSLAGQEIDVQPREAVASGTAVLLCIRPETLTIGTPLTSKEFCVALPGTVVRRTFLGHLMRYTVRVGQQDWLVDQPDPGSAGLAEGSVVVMVNPRRVHVIPGA